VPQISGESIQVGLAATVGPERLGDGWVPWQRRMARHSTSELTAQR
jgi:hypothetical protein